jgi:hypothetical protein
MNTYLEILKFMSILIGSVVLFVFLSFLVLACSFHFGPWVGIPTFIVWLIFAFTTIVWFIEKKT